MLNEIVEDAALFSGYDIIVDDGGHLSRQMLTSFRVSHRTPACAWWPVRHARLRHLYMRILSCPESAQPKSAQHRQVV